MGAADTERRGGEAPPRRAVVLALAAILLVGAFLRLYHLPRYPPGLHSDEAINGIDALRVVHDHAVRVFYPANNGREGLFINLQAVSVWLFGPRPWALRAVSAVFGVGTLAGLFWLIRELFAAGGGLAGASTGGPGDGARIALVATFLVATSIWHVLVSRLGLRAIGAPFWTVWAFYLLLVSWRRASWPLALLAGLVFGLGFHSYTAYRVVPLLAVVLFALQRVDARRQGRTRAFRVHVTVVLAGAVIATAPLAIYFVGHPRDFFGRAGQISVFESKTPVGRLARNLAVTMAMFNVVGDTNPRHNLTGRPWLGSLAALLGASAGQQQIVSRLGRPELFWPIGLLFLWGLSRSLARAAREAPHFFLVCWLAIGALPAVLSDEDLPHALRAVLMTPPVFTFAAIGAVGAYDASVRWARNRLKGRGPAFLTVAWCLGGAATVADSFVTYFHVWGPDPATARAFDKADSDKADQIRALPADVPKYVVVVPHGLDVHVVQFLTDTATAETQARHHLRYVGPGQIQLADLPAGSRVIELR